MIYHHFAPKFQVESMFIRMGLVVIAPEKLLVRFDELEGNPESLKQ
jgi:hypothetical protein